VRISFGFHDSRSIPTAVIEVRGTVEEVMALFNRVLDVLKIIMNK
jgi:hypothetical protein